MNQAIKFLTALGIVFIGIGQMLGQYKEIVQNCQKLTSKEEKEEAGKDD